jgi:predicted  nucleic acid-binding Zn-ribbon protein
MAENPGSTVEALAALCATDMEIAALRAELARLPERTAQLAAKRAEALAIEAEKAIGADLAQGERRQCELEASAAPWRERLLRLKFNLAHADGMSPSDLTALDSEIAHLEARVAEAEEEEIVILLDRDELQSRRSEASALVQEATEKRLAADQALAEAAGLLEARLAELAAHRSEQAVAVDTELLQRYERVRSRAGDPGLAQAGSGSCSGCHLRLSPHELAELKKLARLDVGQCEQCGRLLTL